MTFFKKALPTLTLISTTPDVIWNWAGRLERFHIQGQLLLMCFRMNDFNFFAIYNLEKRRFIGSFFLETLKIKTVNFVKHILSLRTYNVQRLRTENTMFTTFWSMDETGVIGNRCIGTNILANAQLFDVLHLSCRSWI